MPRAYCGRCYRNTDHRAGVCTVCAPNTAQAIIRIPAPATGDLFATPAQAPAQPVNTSEAAAIEISRVLSDTRRKVLDYICAHHPKGLTDNELIAALTTEGWSANTPRARRVELYRGGWLEEAGERDGSKVWRPSVQAWDRWRTMDRSAQGYASHMDGAA